MTALKAAPTTSRHQSQIPSDDCPEAGCKSALIESMHGPDSPRTLGFDAFNSLVKLGDDHINNETGGHERLDAAAPS